jgi:hypothetical protein
MVADLPRFLWRLGSFGISISLGSQRLNQILRWPRGAAPVPSWLRIRLDSCGSQVPLAFLTSLVGHGSELIRLVAIERFAQGNDALTISP